MKRNLLSIKSKVLGALMLGACLTFSIPAATTFAAEGDEQMTIQIESVSIPNEKLTEKQIEIDQYLFKDHAKDIEEKGFKILTTGVIADMVEIGISPYTQENADYLYKLFGSDMVRVVSTEPAELMTVAITSSGSEGGVDGAATSTAAPDVKAVSTGEIMTTTVVEDVAVTSTDDAVLSTTSAPNAANEELVTITAKQEKATSASSTPAVALYTGISVVVLGSIFFVLNKKKAVK